jgi:hypothetical protein
MSNEVKPSVIKKALKLYQESELTTAQICKKCGISWGSLHKYVKKGGMKRRTYPRRQQERRREFSGCPRCKEIYEEPEYSHVDFYHHGKGIAIYKAVTCPSCRRQFFKTRNVTTGEVAYFHM